MSSHSDKFLSLMIWLAGHSPISVRRFHHDEVMAVAKKGPVVLLAAMVATCSWAVSGWSRGMEAEPIAQVLGAIVSGGVGAGVVLALDRFFIFKSDTTEFAGVGRVAWLLVRVVLSLAMASVTADALTPWLFRAGLLRTASVMIEEADATRSQELTRLEGIPEKRVVLERASAAVASARSAMTAIPEAVRAAQAASENCLAVQGNHQKAMLRMNGDDAAFDAKIGLTSRFGSQCEKLDARASRLQEQFIGIGQASLTTAVNAEKAAANALTASEVAANERLRGAREKDLLAFRPASTAVQTRLFEADPAAHFEYFGCKLLITLLELMPLLLQMVGGRSRVGVGLDLETRARAAEREASLLDKALSGELKCCSSQLAINGLAVAARSKNLRETSTANMRDYLRAAGPVVNIAKFADLVDANRPDAHRSAYGSAAFSESVAGGTDILRGSVSRGRVH